MADNITINSGSGGPVVAADDVSSVFYQRVKLSVGADGSATDVSSAAPLPASDNGPGWTQVFGVSGAVFTSADASTAAAVTDAPTSGQKLVIDDVIVSVGSVAMQVDLEIETAGTVYVTIYATANTMYQITPRGKWKLGTADKKLMVDTSAAGAISVTCFYHSEA
jgi:zona occludens toxin (predicted ATPase)